MFTTSEDASRTGTDFIVAWSLYNLRRFIRKTVRHSRTLHVKKV